MVKKLKKWFRKKVLKFWPWLSAGDSAERQAKNYKKEAKKLRRDYRNRAVRNVSYALSEEKIAHTPDWGNGSILLEGFTHSIDELTETRHALRYALGVWEDSLASTFVLYDDTIVFVYSGLVGELVTVKHYLKLNGEEAKQHLEKVSPGCHVETTTETRTAIVCQRRA